MAKGGRSKKKADTVFLVCEETGDYNYTLRRKAGSEKLKLKKYSPRLVNTQEFSLLRITLSGNFSWND